ncbi:toll-like receptor 9 [Arapaima gigas]
MVFQNLPDLQRLSLGFNNITAVPQGLPPSLEILDLKENKISEIGKTEFANLTRLKYLNLEWNCQRCDHAAQPCFPCLNNSSIKLHPRAFQNQAQLTFLSLRGNSLRTLPDGLFQGLQSLTSLDLSDNLLAYSIRNEFLSVEAHADNFLNRDIQMFQEEYCKGKLFLDLSQNNILSLNESIFKGMETAVCLDLSLNYLSQSLNGQQFLPLKKLEYLNMAHNRIDMYYDGAFQELRSTLKVLDLTNNGFHFRMKGMGHRFEFIENLTSLKALSLSDNSIGIRISLTLKSTSLKYLFFSGNHLDIMWDTARNQYSHFFQNLINLVYLDISRNHLVSLSPEVFCNLPKKLKFLKVEKNKLRYFPWHNLTILSDLQYLNLSGNSLTQLPTDDIEFGDNLTTLDLSFNKIRCLPEAFFQKAHSLRYLRLSYNELKFLDTQSFPFQLSATLEELALDGNPFMCSCDTSWFIDFLKTSSFIIPSVTTGIRCGFPESQHGQMVLSMDPRSCQEIFGSVGFLCTSFLTIVLTAVPLLKKLYGWDLWYCVQVFWAGHKGYSQLQNRQGKHDAFIVFDTANIAVRDWVYHELVVNLEERGRQRFSLCLEERDWVPGLSCIENLHSAVYNSKKTVFVLTRAGSASGIPRQAFFMAQQRLLDEKLDTIVLVLLDEIFPKPKYLQMRKMLCKKSVLSWPRNPHAQEHFWNKMRTVLASDNSSSYRYHTSESLLSDSLI